MISKFYHRIESRIYNGIESRISPRHRIHIINIETLQRFVRKFNHKLKNMPDEQSIYTSNSINQDGRVSYGRATGYSLLHQ